MKKLMIYFVVLAMAASIPLSVYGGEKAEINQEQTISVNRFQVGERQVAVKDIVITEAAAGLFEKKQSIYLKAEHLHFEEGIEYTVTKGNIKIKDVKVLNDIIKITIDKASTEASEIKLTNIALYLDTSIPDGIYPLELVTEGGTNYPNNIFGKLYEQKASVGKTATEAVILMDNFAEITTPTSNGILKEQVIVHVEEGTMTINGKTTSIDKPYFLDGYVMLPLRAIVEKLSDSAIVKWDDGTKKITLQIGTQVIGFQIGQKNLNINGTNVAMTVPAQIKDGRVYLPMRDLSYALGIKEDGITWNAEDMTVTLKP